jgi:hypothetical protein
VRKRENEGGRSGSGKQKEFFYRPRQVRAIDLALEKQSPRWIWIEVFLTNKL